MAQVDQSIGIFTVDKNLKIRSWNGWLEEATGITAQRAVGMHLSDLVPDLDKRGLLSRFQAVVTDGTTEVLAPSFHHYLLRCPPPFPSRHSQAMQQRVTIAPLRDRDEIRGAMITVEDVTERLEKERDLAEALQSPDEKTRLRAAEILASEKSLDPVNTLFGALGDESWRVRRVAVDGLARTGSPEAVACLLRALREEHMNIGVLNSALQTLSLMDLDTVSPLCDFLQDPDADLRIYAALALGEMHDPRAVPALIAALQDPNLNVRYHAIEALGKLRSDQAVAPLCEIVETEDFFLAFAALDALKLINHPGIVPRIIPVLSKPLLQEAAIDALGHLGGYDAAPVLADMLNQPDAPATAVCRALCSIYDRFEEYYREGTAIGELVSRTVTEAGLANLIKALECADPNEVRPMALVLGWLRGPGVEQALLRLLGEPSARREVTEALIRHGSGVVELLLESLEDEDFEVRKAAVIALGRIGDRRAVPPLVELLSRDPDLSVLTCGALAKIGDRRAFEALLDLLGNPQPMVRQASIAALNSLGHPEMAHYVRNLLESENPILRESAVKIAGYFGYPECEPLLYERCRDEVESVRCAAIEHIVYLDDDRRTVSVLSEALETGTPKVRSAAVRALAHVPTELALPLLVQSLGDKDPWVRYFAAKSLSRHPFGENQRQNDILPTLIDLALHDSAQHVRIAAIQTLGTVGGKRAIPVLVSLMEDREADAARSALEALSTIHHPDALMVLLDALQKARGARRREILGLLGERGGSQVTAVLQWVAAEERDLEIAAAAIDALARMNSSAAVSALIALAGDPERREHCITALAHLEPRCIEWVGEGLYHGDARVRSAVVEALGRMKHSNASVFLVKALDDTDATVRLSAVAALTKLGTWTGRARLVELARTDPDLTVRRAAQHAIGAEHQPM